MVACTNANGEADLFVCTVWISEEDWNNGKHYEPAKEVTREGDYEGRFVCFDQHEQSNIARQVEELACPVPFTINDKSVEEEQT